MNGVPADDPKGALVHKLIRNGAALYCAHTNADNACRRLGRAREGHRAHRHRPLDATPRTPMDVLTTYVPVADAEQVLKALTEAPARSATTARRAGTVVEDPPLDGAEP